MLKSKISNITNSPVDLAKFKEYIGGLNNTLKDDSIQSNLDSAVVWVSNYSNLPAANFDVEYIQNKANTKHELLFDNITIVSVKNLEDGEDLDYIANYNNSAIIFESEQTPVISYSCAREDNEVLTNAILAYALILFSGQDDKEAINKVMSDLRIIKSEV